MEKKLSYDYTEFIEELEEALAVGELQEDEILQVQKGEESHSYRPIIDWYYSKERMEKIIKDEDTTEAEKGFYEADSPYLEEMTVKEILRHMREVNKII